MKRFTVLAVAVIILLVTISGCGQTTSMGLEYKSNSDGSCDLVGMGNCTDITVVVPSKNDDNETVVRVENSAFRKISGLTAVTLPETVTEIGEYAFADNGSLIRINIPSKVEWIGRSAFLNCPSLKEVILETDFSYAILKPIPNTQEAEVTLGSKLICGTGEEIVDITDENRDEIYKMVFGNAKIKKEG